MDETSVQTAVSADLCDPTWRSFWTNFVRIVMRHLAIFEVKSVRIGIGHHKPYAIRLGAHIDATPVSGGCQGRRTRAQWRVRPRCHEFPELPQRRKWTLCVPRGMEYETRKREETNTVLIMHHIAELPHARGFHPCRVPGRQSAVESEAARAKRCQRKKGDIGQRGARKRRSGSNNAPAPEAKDDAPIIVFIPI
ncbi:hypothetical protein B0H13DRAFT_1894124 [Mycena leptocephala]|nr:hypothetical protein B0H13DRAFT_1894124 [Mycena leptocephala]